MTDPDQIREDTLLPTPAGQRSRADEVTELHRILVGRELHILNLESEVNVLCQKQGDTARYPIRLEQGTATPKAKHLAVRPGSLRSGKVRPPAISGKRKRSRRVRPPKNFTQK